MYLHQCGKMAECDGKRTASPPESSTNNILKHRYRSQLLSDKKRSKTRVNIGPSFARWSQVKESRGLKSHPDVATFLLDWFSRSYQTDGSVEKANPRKRKRPSSVRPQDEETTPGLLNDGVWVNLRCLLQLFQECGRCRAVCTVNTQEDTSHFSVVQYCKACNHWVIWNSQPLKSTSSEDGAKKEDVQVPVSSPSDDGQGAKAGMGSETETASETEAWNEEHFMELEVNIDSDFSDELPLCKLEEDEEEMGEEEKGEEEEEERGEEEVDERGEEEVEERAKEEELVGQQSDEMHKDNISRTEQHHTDAKETEGQVAESVRGTVEVKEEDEEVAIDRDSEVTEDDDWQGKEEDWSEEEQQQQAGNSQTSDSEFEINEPTKRRRPRMRNIFENEGIETGAQEEEWQMDDEEDEDEEDYKDEEEEGWSSEEQKALSKEMKLMRNRDRRKPVYLKRVYLTRSTQRLCPNCGVMYASQTHVCNDKKKFPCPKCGKRRLSELNVNAHIIHCKGLVFPCRFCLEPFQSKLDKVRHENRHQDTLKPYLCTKCPETFDDFFIRNRHLKEHEELTCRTCHKLFSVVHALRRHERSHLDDKPFKCHVCERAFAQGSQLKCHMRVHTGERPYKCQLCPLAFNHNISLKTHIRRYHQNESHPVGPQSHPDSKKKRVTPGGPSSASASDPREQGESAYTPSSDESLDSCQEPQPSRGSAELKVHSMSVQEGWTGEEAESALEDQGGLTFQTQLDIAEGEGGGNACDSRPKRKRPRKRWSDSDFEWGGEKDS